MNNIPMFEQLLDNGTVKLKRGPILEACDSWYSAAYLLETVRACCTFSVSTVLIPKPLY